MQSFTQTALLILAFLFIFGICTETYTLIHQSPAAGARNREYSLDTSWGVHRMSNSRKQTSGPFNTCSPESYEECAKNAMPHLSRY
jgi:hypothetical protein